jgi:hypothetical protein
MDSSFNQQGFRDSCVRTVSGGFSGKDRIGQAIALFPDMKIKTLRLWKAALLSAALLTPIAMSPTPLRAESPRTYHDKQHNDDHQWNAHEDQAYRIYAKENHRKYREFSKVKEPDQQAYWGWRHEHSDALLKIDIH